MLLQAAAASELGAVVEGDPEDVIYDPEPYDLPPQTVDWDELDLQRNVSFSL